VFLGSGNEKHHKLTPALSRAHLILCHRDEEQAYNLTKFCIMLGLLILALNVVYFFFDLRIKVFNREII